LPLDVIVEAVEISLKSPPIDQALPLPSSL
jgi:hypothetical protein